MIPEAWHATLQGLRRAPLPDAREVPLDLPAIAGSLRLALDERTWRLLLTRHRHGTRLEQCAEEWRIPRERARQLELKGLRTLGQAISGQAWPAAIHALGREATAVRIPAEADEPWPLLVALARVSHGPYFRTYPLDGHVWAAVDPGPDVFLPGLWLPPGRFYTEPEAAALSGAPAAVLRAAWPVTKLVRTQSGHYGSAPDTWLSRDWLTALCGVLAAHQPFDERELFAALRGIPGAPAVQDNTLRVALRTHPDFARGSVKGTWLYTPEAARTSLAMN